MPHQLASVLIGLAYLALVVFLIVVCIDQSSGFDEFSQYWGLFGTLVGVTTGAIPAFFFKQQADSAKAEAAEAADLATKEATKANLLEAAIDSGVAAQIRSANPHLF